MWLAAILVVAGLALLVEVYRSHRFLRSNMRPLAAAPSLDRYPSITVIRPVKGVDAGAEDNLRAALRTGYPGEVDTLFVVDDRSEPALPLIEAAIDQARQAGLDPRARVVLSGNPPPGRTGKLNAMIVALRHATGELVAFADSDIRPDRQALRVLVDSLLAHDDSGSAFAPVVVSEPAQTAGDAGYGLLLNGLYGPAAAAAARKSGGTLPFIMGQFMVLRREAIEAMGGLECAQGQFVDDMFLGMRLHQLGFRNVVSPHPVSVIQQDLPLSDFASIYLRWIMFSRSGLPGRDFKLISWLRGAVFWVGLLLTALALVLGHELAAALLATVPLAMTVSINGLHHAFGSPRLRARHALVSFALVLVAPAVMALTYVLREVNWRGRVYKLNGGARLATQPPPAPARIEPSVDLEPAPAASRGAS